MVHSPNAPVTRSRLLGIALAMCLVIAGVSASSASALSISATGSFTTSGPVQANFVDSGQQKWSCAGSTGSGTFTSTTGGTIGFTFTGCTFGGSNCTTPGQPAGTVKTPAALPFRLVWLDAAHTKFGILIEQSSSSTFADAGFFCKIWQGGLIGEITSPALNVLSTQFTLRYAAGATAGSQQYRTADGVLDPFGFPAVFNLTRLGSQMSLSQTMTAQFAFARKFIP